MAGTTNQVDMEQSFNDSELEDIMNEIESLEKEFVEETQEEPMASESLKIEATDVPENDIQSVIDKEMAPVESSSKTLDSSEEKQEETVEVVSADTSENLVEELVSADTETVQEEDISSQDQMLEQLEDIANDEIEEQVAVREIPKVKNNVVSLVPNHGSSSSATSQSRAETEMSFSVSGQMDLKLSFCIGGQTIGLVVNETEGFLIEMGNGVRFTVPIAQTSSQKHSKAS